MGLKQKLFHLAVNIKLITEEHQILNNQCINILYTDLNSLIMSIIRIKYGSVKFESADFRNVFLNKIRFIYSLDFYTDTLAKSSFRVRQKPILAILRALSAISFSSP